MNGLSSVLTVSIGCQFPEARPVPIIVLNAKVTAYIELRKRREPVGTDPAARGRGLARDSA